ncbi:MAG: PKD domain-containing protein, partial [Bacteroidota bacterium]
ASAEQDWMVKCHFVQVDFIGANKNAEPLAFGRSETYYNYFLGKDQSRWASKAYAYDGILYSQFYEGINLKVYSAGENLKYDFVVAPYADPSLILVNYTGVDEIFLDRGDLVIKTSLSSVTEKKPLAYQYINGEKVIVKCEYYLSGSLLSFCFPEGYDPCYELVIDPLLIFSTYSGSTADNWGSTATPGEHGNLYSAGVTNQTNGGTFPATAGAFQTIYGGQYDIGILKYDSAGHQLLYATYLGGTNSESPHSLVVNSQHELIVLGTTSSVNFPTTTGAIDQSYNGGSNVTHVVPYTNGSDIFVARISKDGSQLLGSTFLGGIENDGLNPPGGDLTKNYGDELRSDIITDISDNIYISSVTSSPNFPVTKGVDLTYNGGVTDAVLMKLNNDLSAILWSTFIGGSGTDASHTLKLDAQKNIFIAGGTTSPNFPVTTGSYQTVKSGGADGWIAKIYHEGDSIIKSTFTGTSSFDQVYFLDINEDEEVYVYGQTSGSLTPSPGVYSNPGSGQFVQKFNTSLSTLIFQTVFGSGRGIPDISPTAFLVNECNNLYMSGWGGIVNSQTPGHWPSNTFGMPVSPDAFQKTTSGSDFYFIVLTDDASQFLYGTYLGGTLSRTHVDGGTSRFDKGGIVYHAVCSGCSAFNAISPPRATSDFPTTPGAWSRTNNSINCNNAAFKFDLSSLKARLQTNSVKLDMPGLKTVCMPDKIVFQNFSTGGEIFQWDLGDGTRITKLDTTQITHQYMNPGQYLVKLKAIDQGTCKVVDSTATVVTINKAQVEIQDDDNLCEGSGYQLQGSKPFYNGAVFHWKTEDNSFQSNEQKPLVNPQDTTIYYVTYTEANGCVRKDTVQLDVIPSMLPDFELLRDPNCLARPFITVRNLTDSLFEDDELFFDFGDGITADQEEIDHTYESDGLYRVKLVGKRIKDADENEFCVEEKAVMVPVFKLTIPNVITPGDTHNFNDKFTIQYGEVQGVTPANYGIKVSVIVYNRWGTIVYESDDYQYDWAGEGLAAGIYYYEVSILDHVTCKDWIHLIK